MSDSTVSETPTVLFVDDSVTDRTRGVGLIHKRHPQWSVLQASSGQQGLDELSQSVVNVVVCDLVMPEMDGRQFLKSVRQRFPETPVVLITSKGDDQIAAECVETGAVNYVPKRRLADDLVRVLDEVVNNQREAVLLHRVLKHVDHNRCDFEITNDLNQVRSLANYDGDRLKAFQRFRPETINNIATAVREALLNAYFHGNLGVNATPLQHTRAAYTELAIQRKALPETAGRHIRLSMELDASRIRFCVSDDGMGFDRSAIAQITGPPNDAFLCGNGLRRMGSFMDTVSFNDVGNEVTLTRSLESFG